MATYMGRELELKLEIDPRHIDRLRSLPMLGGPPQVERLTSTYFDTPKGRLKRAGWVLRVRRHGDSWMMTVKKAGQGLGLFDREEWEVVVNGPEPELQALAATPVKELIKPSQFRHLGPIFRSDVERTSWTLMARSAAIELCLDLGEISAGASSVPISELELELKDGDVAALLAATKRIARRIPVRLAVHSKSEHGRALASGKCDGPAKASSIALHDSATVEDGFRTILLACLRHFRLNEPLLVRDGDAEALHQLRVAIRRLRTVLWLFKPATKGREHEGLNKELASLTRELGAARNIDVILASMVRGDPARSQLEKDRRQLYAKIVRKLDSLKFRNFIIEILAWAHSGDWRFGKRASRPLMPFAIKRLDRLWDRIESRATELAHLPVEQRHHLRIETKKIRYALEFLSELLKGGGKSHEKFVRAAEDVQDSLGLLNDLATRREILGVLPGSPAKLAARHLRDARKAFREMERIGPYWRQAGT